VPSEKGMGKTAVVVEKSHCQKKKRSRFSAWKLNRVSFLRKMEEEKLGTSAAVRDSHQGQAGSFKKSQEKGE